MGDESVDPSPDKRIKQLLGEVYPDSTEKERAETTYRQLFEELCPKYMAYGATYEDFWHGDTAKLRMLRKAHRERQMEANVDMWIQGQYFYHAVSTALTNAFLPKGKQPYKYLERPFDIYGVSEEEAKRRAAAEAKKAHDAFKQWSIALKHKRDKDNGTGSDS